MYYLLLIGLVSAVNVQQCLNDLSEYSLSRVCFNILLSKLLGYALVVTSFILKFPQILKLYKNYSVEGISLSAFYIEALGFTILSAYSLHNNQPFSTYGEQIVISIQCIIQVLLY